MSVQEEKSVQPFKNWIKKTLVIGGLVLIGFVFLIITLVSYLNGGASPYYSENTMAGVDSMAPAGIALSSSPYESSDYAYSSTEEYQYSEDTYYHLAVERDKKIIKTGTIDIESKEAYESMTKIKNISQEYESFFEDEQSYENDYGEYSSLVVRIPSQNFDKFVDALKNDDSLGKVKNLDISQSDQSSYYRDMKADLESAEKELAAVESILSQAKTVEEVLMIRDRSTALRSEVNRLKVSLSDVDEKVTYSTLYITVTAPGAIKGEDNWWRNTLQNVVNSFQNTISVLILFLTVITPWALFVAVLYFIIKFIKKRVFKK